MPSLYRINPGFNRPSVLEKLQKFAELLRDSEQFERDEESLNSAIEQFNGGHCVGFTYLWIHAAHLTFLNTAKKKGVNSTYQWLSYDRYDLDWFYARLESLIVWDEKTLSQDFVEKTEAFLEQLLFLHHPRCFIVHSAASLY